MAYLESKTKQELVEIYNSTERRFSNGTQGEFARRGVAVLAEKDFYIREDGSVRWIMSDNMVPSDIMEMAVVDGTLTIDQRNKAEEIRIVEDKAFLDLYVKSREKYGYSEEEKAEMRANSDGEEDWYDIFTGKRIAL